MTTYPIQINNCNLLPSIPPCLSEIAHKKVEGLALSCFEAIAHWFLTVFSCFYPAYERFYSAAMTVQLSEEPTIGEIQEQGTENGNPVSVVTLLESTPVSLSSSDLSQEIRDRDLITVFKSLCLLPISLSDENTPAQNAANIRTWLQDPANREDLESVSSIYIEDSNLQSWPPEMSKFKYVTTISIINCPDFSQFPDDFNPSSLRTLNLKKTALSAFPLKFNPKRLWDLYVGYSPLTAFPEPFNPPKLTSLILEQVPMTELPENFNPEFFNWTEALQSMRKIPVTSAAASEVFPLTEEVVIASLEPDPAQELKDRALIKFVSCLGFGVVQHLLPQLSGQPATDASTIRLWMAVQEFSGMPPIILTTKMLNVRNEMLKEKGFPLIDATPFPLPSEISFFKKINGLTIDFSVFSELPEDLDLPNLEELRLQGNFTHLPETLMTHQKLRVLEIIESDITELSEKFNPEQLQFLKFDHTKIAQLPPALSKHEKLRMLCVEYSQMTEFRDDFNPPNLQKLSFLGTKISNLPAAKMPNLMELKIHHDFCEKFPLEFEPSESFDWNRDQRMLVKREEQLKEREKIGFTTI